MLRKLVKFVVRNHQVKLTALAIALVLWFYGNSRLRAEARVRVPIVFNVPPSHQIIYQSTDRVQLRLRGPQGLIERLQQEATQDFLRMQATLDPEQFQGGMASIQPQPTWLNIPEQELVQLEVSALEARAVRLYLSRRITRTVPVEVQTSGAPSEGYSVRERRAVPAEVEVSGPAAALEQIEAVRTRDIPVWDLTEDLKGERVGLVLSREVAITPDLNVPVSFSARPAQVLVHLDVAAQLRERRLEGIPVQRLEPVDFPYRVSIQGESEVSVVVKGLPQVVERIDPDSVTAYVNLHRLGQERIAPGGSALYREKVQLLPLEGAAISADTPQPDQVTIELKNTAQ